MNSSYDIILTCNYSPWSSYSGGGQKSTHMLACAYSTMGYSVAVIYTKSFFEKLAVPSDLPYDVHWSLFAAIKPNISSIFRWLNGFFLFYKARSISSKKTVLIGNGDEASMLSIVRHKAAFIFCCRYPNPPNWLRRVDWKRLLSWLYVGFREPRFWAIARSIAKANAVANTSKSAETSIKKTFPLTQSKSHVVPNGIDPLFLSAPLKTEAGAGILYYGRFTIEKGVRELIASYEMLPFNIQQEHALLLIGQGPLLDFLQVKAKANPNIQVVSWQTSMELTQTIRKARLVVLPSYIESFGNTMLESLAIGQVLITCDAGSITEVVQDKAILVPQQNALALNNAIISALGESFNLAKAENQRSWVAANYSWESAAQKLLETLEKK